MSQYERKETYNTSEILPFLTLPNTPKLERKRDYDGDLVKMDSQRYYVFRESLNCHYCNIEGVKFCKERTRFLDPKRVNNSSYHFNLYAVVDGEDVLMTKDHVIPRSEGGRDIVSNYVTCCTKCNNEKGSTSYDEFVSLKKEELKLLSNEESLHKNNLIEMLDELITTMTLTNQEKMKMASWVSYLKPNKRGIKEFECGYAACVIGDHVIRTCGKPLKKLETDDIIDLSESYVAKLIQSCNCVFGNSLLVQSIYEGEYEDRLEDAERTRLFTNGELKQFNHLQSNSPTPKDVIIYIDACIEKLNKFEV